MLVSGSAVTNRIDHLERAGHVQRRREPVDRRSVRVRLTDSGRSRADHLDDAFLPGEREPLGALRPRERRLLESLLRKLLVALDAWTAP